MASNHEKYIGLFGKICSVGEQVPWTTGLSNMLEWLTWETRGVLGVSKTDYWKRAVAWANAPELRDFSLEEKFSHVEKKFAAEARGSRKLDRYSPWAPEIAHPHEALRRAKFFSEDYLNKEFDIFWSLASDHYLDDYYRQFTSIAGGGEWFTHGNSALFRCSTGINQMQMDNISYNPGESILVANELKLGGKKNPDQILKYALMYRLLRDRGFIEDGTRFLLLFIGDREMKQSWSDLIEAELEHCRANAKSTQLTAIESEGVRIAREAEYASTTWRELVEFNEAMLDGLDPRTQQTECKLLSGFNDSINAKNWMVRS
jgi:hypothetical protein